MYRKHPRTPDPTDAGRKRAHTTNCGSAIPTDDLSLNVGGEQCLVTDAEAYPEGSGSEKPQPDPTSEDEQAATELVLAEMDVDDRPGAEAAEDVVLRLIGNLISDNAAIPGSDGPHHGVETHEAEPAETSPNAQNSWEIILNGDLKTLKSSVALKGVPTKTIPAVLRLLEALSTLLASSSTIPGCIPGTPCGSSATRKSPDLNTMRDKINKAAPVIGTRANAVMPAASREAPFTDAEIRTEINRVCAEAGEGIPDKASKDEIKKQYLEGTIKLFGMVGQLKRRAELCHACERDGQECLVVDEERERVLKAVRCVRCIARKGKCEDA